MNISTYSLLCGSEGPVGARAAAAFGSMRRPAYRALQELAPGVCHRLPRERGAAEPRPIRRDGRDHAGEYAELATFLLARRRAPRGANLALPTYWRRLPTRARIWPSKLRAEESSWRRALATNASPDECRLWQKYERASGTPSERVRGAQPSGPSSWGVGGPILPFGPQLSKESLQNREPEFQSARLLSWRLKSITVIHWSKAESVLAWRDACRPPLHHVRDRALQRGSDPPAALTGVTGVTVANMPSSAGPQAFSALLSDSSDDV